jgi:FMN phosphatase YigB (HAD superfamily)
MILLSLELMIRAIFFDFYSVWTPDKFGFYLANAQLNGPEAYKKLYDDMERYYHGEVDIEYLAEAFRYNLGHPDITSTLFKLNEADISGEIVNFIRSLHGHFIKIGILANLGPQENKLLSDFNEHNQLFELIASPLSLGIKTQLLNQEVFAKALQSIGEPPTSCLLVSGNPYYLAFASLFGLRTLQFEGLPQLEQSVGTMLASETP